MSDEKDRELSELRERLARLEGAKASPAGPAKKPFGAGCGPVAAVVLLLGAVMYSLTQCGGGLPSGMADPSWTPPPGYVADSAATGGGIATKWDTPTRAECRDSGASCFALDVITERPCPRSLYASVTLLDAGGRNIGWTNDTAQGVQAGESTRLVFHTYERNAESARIAELHCY